MKKAMLGAAALLGGLACRPIIIQNAPPPAAQPETEQTESAAAPPASSELSEAPEETTASVDTSGVASEPKPPEQPAPPADRPERPRRTPKPPPADEPDSQAEGNPGTPAPESPSTPAPETRNQVVVQRIDVRVEGAGTGVVARVYRIDPRDQSTFFAATGESGMVQPGTHCERGDRFEARPEMPIYIGVEKKPCAERIAFELPSAQAVEALVRLGDEAMQQGQVGLAHSYYATAAKRLRKVDPEAARQLRVKANAAAGRALGLETPGETPNRQMLEALREYQRRSKLPVTGQLDLPTQRALGGVDEDTAMKRANAAPKPERKRPRLELPRQRMEPPVQPSPENGVQQKPRNDAVPGLQPKMVPR